MVKEAEEFAEADKAVKEKVTARNGLETYCYNIRNQLNDSLGELVSEDEQKTMLRAVDDALEWLEDEVDAEANDFKEKMNDLQDVCHPIISRAHEKDGGMAGDGDSENERDRTEL